jgi:Protein of unknown function (DUF1549)/Protein of unknown function (DUF1553)
MRPALAAAILFLACGTGVGGDTPNTGTGGKDKAARKIAAAIDKHITADWTARGIKPAPLADDEEFCRRVYLDIIGRIPKVSEVRAFAADPGADKRWKLVETLLSKPGYANHMAEAIRAAWLPETISDQFKSFLGENYEAYLRRKLAVGVPLDQIVKETLTADVQVGQRGRIAFTQNADSDSQALQFFYQALEAKPENLGSMVTRALLGVKLECAQCHDHPFAPYTREQFWQFAAFFGEFTPLPPVGPSFVGPLQPQYAKNRITIPGNAKGGNPKQVSARFLDDSAPVWNEQRTPRQELAEWIGSANNPYFARNVVNRVWHQYFGVGIVEPIDEPGDANPPSHPELLDELATAFRDSGFDLRVLVKGITGSRAYQLTSKLTHPTQADPRRFARMNMKGLTGSQIFDSFVTATGVRVNPNGNVNRFDTTTGGVNRFSYQSLFPIPQKPAETQTSILQALTVMNGRLVADQTSIEKGEVLGAIADAPFLTTDKKVEALFLAALTRKPTDEEKEKFGSYVERGGPSGDKNKALADAFWVLLNSTEFLFNH